MFVHLYACLYVCVCTMTCTLKWQTHGVICVYMCVMVYTHLCSIEPWYTRVPHLAPKFKQRVHACTKKKL